MKGIVCDTVGCSVRPVLGIEYSDSFDTFNQDRCEPCSIQVLTNNKNTIHNIQFIKPELGHHVRNVETRDKMIDALISELK